MKHIFSLQGLTSILVLSLACSVSFAGLDDESDEASEMEIETNLTAQTNSVREANSVHWNSAVSFLVNRTNNMDRELTEYLNNQALSILGRTNWETYLTLRDELYERKHKKQISELLQEVIRTSLNRSQFLKAPEMKEGNGIGLKNFEITNLFRFVNSDKKLLELAEQYPGASPALHRMFKSLPADSLRSLDQITEKTKREVYLELSALQMLYQSDLDFVSLNQNDSYSRLGDQGSEGKYRKRSSNSLFITFHFKENSTAIVALTLDPSFIDQLYALTETRQVDSSQGNQWWISASRTQPDKIAYFAALKDPKVIFNLFGKTLVTLNHTRELSAILEPKLVTVDQSVLSELMTVKKALPSGLCSIHGS